MNEFPQQNISVTELRKAVADISEIQRAGCLNDMWAEFRALCNESPLEDLGCCSSGIDLEIRWLADTASQVLGVPVDDCLAAAIDNKLCTRRKVMLKAIGRTLQNIERRKPV